MSDTEVAPRPFLVLDDLKAGFLVFLIALPLSLGIAMASSFPAAAGLLTAIIGGTVATLCGSARLTIKGPAAGLIVIAVAAVQDLGQGDPVAGYRRALAAGVIAAILQIALALGGAATAGIAMSPSVVHGMLAAIGVIIISKQIHTILGVTPQGHEPLELLAEIPRSLANANPEVLILGAVSLLILFALPRLRTNWVKRIPGPLIVLAITVPLALWFDFDHEHSYSLFSNSFRVGPQYLVPVPASLLDAVAFPDFSRVFSLTSLQYAITFALIGTIESTLSVVAIDGLDPRRQPSDLNRDLLSVGIGNLIAALVGGLPMISEIVRSKANVDAGAQSRWANFSHGMLLLTFLVAAPGLLHEIPLAALAAMLVYTGFRLASPSEFFHARSIGVDQLLLFTTTLFVTLATDLLIGVGCGLALKVMLHLTRGASIADLWKARIDQRQEDQTLYLDVEGAATFANLLAVNRILAARDRDVKRVVVDLTRVKLVDHTFLSRLASIADEWPDTTLEYIGINTLEPVSPHPFASRRRMA